MAWWLIEVIAFAGNALITVGLAVRDLGRVVTESGMRTLEHAVKRAKEHNARTEAAQAARRIGS